MNFHESYRQGEIKPPTERSTGMVFAIVAVVIAAIRRDSHVVLWVGISIAALLATVSMISPQILKPLNILWFRFGLLLHRIINPIVMFAMFALVIVPAGYIMRIWHDPLRRQRAAANSTYWIERKASGQETGSMTNQF
jgi:predicted CDP-diglyceride synthetase/phosphatidate cytidylyltransferase